MRRSLRVKVALVFSALTIALLVAQALGVRVLAEAQEEKLITALIQDDMANVLRSYAANPSILPPLDARLQGYVSMTDRLSTALPPTVRDLPDGTHELILGGREIHVAIAPVGAARLYRIYNFNAYEKHFKEVVNVLMAGTGVFALLTLWLAFGLSGLLVRQVAGLAQQVKALRHDHAAAINPGRYDEHELVGLVEAFNDYHRRMADMIAREKEFTGNVSHELRTPLTAIKTSCELLEQDAAIAGKSRMRLRQIDRAADSMRELVNALLMLAREESAEDVEPLCLARAIETALAPFAGRLADKGIDAQIAVGRALHVVANQSALAIVLSNVIDNAVRHTGHGHLRFSYANGWLHIEDTGLGIPADALPHVFDRLYRAETQDVGSHGFGIGLAIVKKLCDRYGWPIELDSEAGRGTRVSLRLIPANPRSAGPEAGLTPS
ncbi:MULTISPECIES: sensor histidine kinase [Burkholderia]|uniref:histidine kinase n=1 Tax=Burkholderia contaminans TaxID=488447 RepID=A0A3N8QS88_9BURK|nr:MULTISPECIES: HAMP domain-containing sensor histidine kinase [Burkholderia]MDD1494074.1 HAMP domain-containing histidine kinase [Burkholderia thailandensis]RQT22146.1 sensor histidine kinase [Burkholderia contaminans]